MDLKKIHDAITKAYYEDKTLTEAEFLRLHKAYSLLLDKQELAAGRIADKNIHPERTSTVEVITPAVEDSRDKPEISVIDSGPVLLRSDWIEQELTKIDVKETELAVWEK